MSLDAFRMVPTLAGRICVGFLTSGGRSAFANAIEAAAAVEESPVPACPGCSK